jgi:hypothetical protein
VVYLCLHSPFDLQCGSERFVVERVMSTGSLDISTGTPSHREKNLGYAPPQQYMSVHEGICILSAIGSEFS